MNGKEIATKFVGSLLVGSGLAGVFGNLTTEYAVPVVLFAIGLTLVTVKNGK